MSRIRQAKAALLDRLEEIVRELVPGGHKSGSTYTAKNPARADRNAGSFVVWLRGVAAGGWKDYATGEQGDIIDLVCLAKATDRAGALEWAEDRLGMKSMPAETRRAMEAAAVAKRHHDAAEAEQREARQIDRARKIFAEASPALAGTPVETYLASRGIPLAELRHLEDNFRFLPAMEWWMGAEDRDGRRQAGPRFPCLVSRMVDGAGIHKANHFTFIAPDGSGKAKVSKPKLMFPATAGLVIRIARGQGNRNAETAGAGGHAGPCVVMEGIEDGMSIALACPELRVWAAGSLPGILHLPDHAAVDGWIIVQDNDWGKDKARELFEKAVARIQSFGKPVSVVASTLGKDMNDLLRGEG